MKTRLWPALLAGFGTLIFLVGLAGISVLRTASSSYAGTSLLYQRQHDTEQLLNKLRSDIQSSALAARDFLLDPDASVPETRRQLRRVQDAMASELTELKPNFPAEDSGRLLHLQEDIAADWQSLDPLFRWSPAEKARLSRTFLRREVLPRREAILGVLTGIQELTWNSVSRGRREIDERQQQLPRYVERMIVLTILIALFVAALSLFRIVDLEKIARRQREARERAEGELRNLSRQLVHAHEEERRALSRELHDQIGQTLTAVRINLGNVEENLMHSPDLARADIEQTRRLSEQALRSVREIAMGLRPAMLDDLGLVAALEWLARQHSRICKVPVTVSAEGGVEDLTDTQRTCVYRVVQEALNNSAKHAHASEIRVKVRANSGAVSLAIEDDGQGFDMAAPRTGLGLIGMKERVHELGGQILIQSEPGQGTALLAEIPFEAGAI